MVPRLHARGTSFRGASQYLLHDKDRAKSAERVAWTEVLNCWSDRAEDAWFEMWDTWRERSALKRAAGIAPGGRDNTKPVLHFSLSWHPDEKPTEQQMKDAARAALKTLGLQDHQAVLVSHNDEPHPHVHIMVNTVHRITGQTAKLTYSKEGLSRWAEEYERANGKILCEERVKNNEKRQKLKAEREVERAKEKFDRAAGRAPAPRKPYQPVKDRSPHRREWFARQDIINRMKELRADLNLTQRIEREGVWKRHEGERQLLDQTSKEKAKAVRESIRETFRPAWKATYHAQKMEMRELAHRDHIFERAAFVFSNRDRLAAPGKRLTLKEMIKLILSPKALRTRLEIVHERERRALASRQNRDAGLFVDRVWQSHREQALNLRSRQQAERAALKDHHKIEREDISFARAKADLVANPPKPAMDRAVSPPTPDPAPSPAPKPEKRSERIARQMQEYQNRNKGRDDFEREI